MPDGHDRAQRHVEVQQMKRRDREGAHHGDRVASFSDGFVERDAGVSRRILDSAHHRAFGIGCGGSESGRGVSADEGSDAVRHADVRMIAEASGQGW